MALVYSTPLILSKSFPSLPSSPTNHFGGKISSTSNLRLIGLSCWCQVEAFHWKSNLKTWLFLWLWAEQVITPSVSLFHSRKEKESVKNCLLGMFFWGTKHLCQRHYRRAPSNLIWCFPFCDHSFTYQILLLAWGTLMESHFISSVTFKSMAILPQWFTS